MMTATVMMTLTPIPSPLLSPLTMAENDGGDDDDDNDDNDDDNDDNDNDIATAAVATAAHDDDDFPSRMMSYTHVM